MRFISSIMFCDSFFNCIRFRKGIFDALGFVIEIGYCCNSYFNWIGLCDGIFYALGFAIECTDVFNFAIHISTALDFVMEFFMHWVDPLH